MSKRPESSASIVRVKGVSFNYLQFLWQQLGLIATARQQGNYPVALKLCTELIVWLPRSLKNIFLERALTIQKDLLTIRSNNLPQLQQITDIHQRTALRNKLLSMYSSAALTAFINDLTTKLDAMGYMENTKTVVEGDADEHGEGAWTSQTDYDEKKDRGKYKKRKSRDSPEGIMF